MVEDLHATIESALRVLDDAELDSAKARLTDRGDFYLEAAAEHLAGSRRRATTCRNKPTSSYGYLNRAPQSVAEAHNILDQTETSDPASPKSRPTEDPGRRRRRDDLLAKPWRASQPITSTAHVAPASKSPQRPCSSR